MTTNHTIDWSAVDQTGGTIGSAGTITTMTGTPSSAINNVTFEGDVRLDNNGAVTFQDVTIASGSSITVQSGTTLTLNQSNLMSGTINMDGGTLSNTNAYSSSGPLVINFEATTSTKSNVVSLNAYNLSNVTFKNVSPGDNITFINSYGKVSLVDDGSGVITVNDANGKTLTTLYTAKNLMGRTIRLQIFQFRQPAMTLSLFVFLLAA